MHNLNKTKIQKLLLIISYLSFISLGLPDQILGVAWVDMRSFFSKPLDYGGVLLFITTIFTITSSFLSSWFIKKFNISKILITSCLLTAMAIMGYGLSFKWWNLILFSVILGLGAGTIDATLNDWAAKNYSPKHMNFLHGFWGVGATLGAFIMTSAIKYTSNWRFGYILVSLIQFVLCIIFFTSKKLWNITKTSNNLHLEEKNASKKDINILSPEAIGSMVFFLIYVCLESSIGLWFCSVMVESYHIKKEIAGILIVLYWGSLTLGRFLTGLMTKKFSSSKLITNGILFAILGIFFLFSKNIYLITFGLILTGLSLSGLYPNMMHETPKRFNDETATVLTGYQVGFANIGLAILTPMVGFMLEKTSLALFPIILLGLSMFLCGINFYLVKRLVKSI